MWKPPIEVHNHSAGWNKPGGKEFPVEMLPCGPASLPPHCWRWSTPGWPPKNENKQTDRPALAKHKDWHSPFRKKKKAYWILNPSYHNESEMEQLCSTRDPRGIQTQSRGLIHKAAKRTKYDCAQFTIFFCFPKYTSPNVNASWSQTYNDMTILW